MRKKQISRAMLLKATLCAGMLAAPCAAVQAFAEPLPVTSPAADVKVTGTVYDEDGEPLIGVTVMVKGTANGTATDYDGKYSIDAPAGSELVYSYIGCITKTVKVSKAGVHDVILESDSKTLSDVVVIGYGTAKKGDLTSAVASVKAEDFTQGAIGDAAELVKGKVAGLTIAKGSGDPNAESTIRMRGVISLSGGSTPLVLIDGVAGSLTDVAPESIASIDVLKDASAAAIYGTRGANGVIIITTKAGVREQKTTASYSGYASWASMAKKHKFMTAQDVRNGMTNYTDRGYDTDWLDAVTRTAFTHNHDFQVTGGSSKTTYSGNVSYRKAEGVILNTFNEEIKMNFDLSHWFFNDMLKVHMNLLKGIHKDSGLNGADRIYRQAIMRNPTEPIYGEDGLPYENLGITYYYNPVGLIEQYEGEVKSEWSRMAGDLTFEPIKGWQTKVFVSTDRSNGHSASFKTSDHVDHVVDGYSGDAYHGYSYSQSNLLEVTSNYRNTFKGVHRFDALVGYSWQRNTYDGFSAWNADFGNDFFKYNNIGIGSLLKDGKASMGSYKNDNTLIGFFGRVSYGYDNRYNVLVSVRREGSSKFGDNHKWGTFPSVSAGWNVMNENFWAGLPVSAWWDQLKVRAGYGVTGVIPSGSYASLTQYNFGDYFFNDGVWQKGLVVASNPNPDLKWETSGELNVGIDWDMFAGRFGGSVDFYNKETRDMLWWYDVPVPPNLYSTTLANVGKMRNTGIELMVRGIPVQTKDFSWETTATFSHNSNKLLSLSNGMYETANEHETAWLGEPISQATHRLEVGKAVDRYFGIKSVGVSERGLWMVEDPTGKYTADGQPGIVELSDDMLPDSDMKQDLGNSLPKFYMGWNNTFRYKAFDLSMQFTGQFGFKILNEARCYYENNSVNYNRLQSVLEAPYGDRVLAGNQKQTFVSYYLENGDFFKMTNLTLGYTVPMKKNNFVESIRAYVSCENLFTLTKYKGLDPELSNGDATASGIEWRDNYPTNRSFTVGLNINF